MCCFCLFRWERDRWEGTDKDCVSVCFCFFQSVSMYCAVNASRWLPFLFRTTSAFSSTSPNSPTSPSPVSATGSTTPSTLGTTTPNVGGRLCNPHIYYCSVSLSQAEFNSLRNTTEENSPPAIMMMVMMTMVIMTMVIMTMVIMTMVLMTMVIMMTVMITMVIMTMVMMTMMVMVGL